MSVEIHILGTGSATPVFNRHPSAHYINFNNHIFLVDCGEGTQFQLLKYRLSHNKISAIFITHLHGDHYLGLLGLISTMQLWGRQRELFLYGPKGLSEIITIQLKYSDTVIKYPLHFVEVDTERSYRIIDDDSYFVQTIPLLHRIHCCGFLFKEKPKNRRVNKELAGPEITPHQRIALREGKDITDEQGNVIPNEHLTLPPKKSLAYAYCSDTIYTETILPYIQGADLLYHEATFDNYHTQRASETYHTTAEQAAMIASKAEVGQLMIGHFSSRYRSIDTHLAEAKALFPNTFAAEEGKIVRLSDES